MVSYFDYRSAKAFYTIPEACGILGISKKKLREKSEQQNIHLRQNKLGKWGLSGHDLCSMHYKIYHENRHDREKSDPWT